MLSNDSTLFLPVKKSSKRRTGGKKKTCHYREGQNVSAAFKKCTTVKSAEFKGHFRPKICGETVSNATTDQRHARVLTFF